MKFHKLQIQNVNSLYGDHVIDLDGAFGEAALFLIMGPIGSGKSTLLDAICLALFGTTPRQRDVASVVSVAEHVMSQRTGEAKVVLEFSRLDAERGRVRYRAGWYCNRAYKRANGNMQKPNRSLDVREVGRWKPLANSDTVKEYADAFDEALAGMTLDDFLRSVLLAQGDFTAFLDADEATKANILEKLTNTQEFQRIGARAMGRWQEARGAVEAIDNKLEVIDIRDDEAFEALKEQKASRQKEAEQLKERLETAQAQLTWLETLDERTESVDEAGKALQTARDKKEARADDYERLALARRARPVAGKLGRFDALAEDIDELAEDIEGLEERREKTLEGQEQAKEKLEATASKLESANKALEAKKADIEQARTLRRDLDKAKGVAETAEKAFEEAKEVAQQTETGLESATKEASAAKERVDKAQQAREALAEHEGITEAFAGLEAQADAHSDQAERIQAMGDEHETWCEQRVELCEELRDLREAIEAKKEAAEPLSAAHEASVEALGACLEGAESAAERRKALQGERDDLIERLQIIERAGERLEHLRQAREQQASVQKQLDAGREELEAIGAALDGLDERLELASERVEAREASFEMWRHRVRLAEERHELDDGQPCPVCGSKQHPWAGSERDEEFAHELDEASSELEDARDKLDELKEARTELRERQIRVGEVVENRGEQLDEKQRRIDQLADKLGEDRGELELEWDLQELSDAEELLADARRAAAERKDELDASATRLERAQEKAKKAKQALDKAERDLKKLQDKRALDEQKLEGLDEKLITRTAAIEASAHKLASTADKLREAFASVGVTVEAPTAAGFERALKTADKRRAERAEASTRLQEAKEAVAESQKTVDELEALLPERRKAAKAAEEAHEKAHKEVKELTSQLEEVLDGRDPDEVEEEHKAAIEDAKEAHEGARERLQQVSGDLKELDGALESKREQHEKSVESRDKLDRQLAAACRKAEFESLEAAREAVLEEEKFETLRAELEALAEAVAGAKTTLDNACDKLDAHREQRPEALDEGCKRDHLAESVEALGGQLDEFKETIGGYKKQIEQEEEHRQKHAKLCTKRAAADRQRARWKTIHDLIGQRGGAKFKEFAQALNLERIVYRANEHLEQLHDRYRLVVPRDESGHPTLSFEVVDHFQGRQARAISTLSGGETFLVSLALALALADFRQVRMPVETLLLDEGFGTLDQNSLRQAVTTLNSLHARDNRQVGVISHVEQLQDQIAYRIVVEKLGGGMSSVDIETPLDGDVTTG